MKKMISTEALGERIAKNSSALNKTVTRGNVRGIGVESLIKESAKGKLSRDKARILKKMSPSLDRGLQILSGMIACPEGGVRTNLNYTMTTPKGVSDEKFNRVLSRLKEYFEDDLDLENGLHDMVYRVISETGAEVEVYIPTTLVDEVLGVESTGFVAGDLDPAKNTIKYNNKHLSLGTNLSLLTQVPLSVTATVGNEAGSADSGRSRISRINATTLGIESDGKVGKDSVIVRRTTGEAVIPILYNGRVIKYVGILDKMGNFVSTGDRTSFSDLMTTSGDGAEKDTLQILSNEASLLNKKTKDDTYDKVRKSIEDDVILALTGKSDKNGLDSIIQSLGEENVIDIITARSMAAKNTRIVMIDPEYVSYFSLLENENGKGITVIEDNSSIILLHVTLLYAKILSELESSVPHTVATVTLDENDQNSESTLKDIMGELAHSVVDDYELDYSGDRNLFRSLSKMGTSIKVNNADIPGMPKMDVDIERTQRDIRGPSTDILDTVGKYATQAICISAENVDNSYSEKFKIQVTRDNDITNRQLVRYTSAVDTKLTDRGRKRVSHNDELWEELLALLGGPAKEDALIEMLATLKIKLPEHTSSKFENFSTNMELISRALDDYLKVAIPDTVIDNGERVDRESLSTMREMVAGSVMRSYAANADLFGGLGLDLTSMEGIADIVNSELEDYGDSFKGMASVIRKFNKTILAAVDKIAEEETPPAVPEGDESPATDDTTNVDEETETDDTTAGGDVTDLEEFTP